MFSAQAMAVGAKVWFVRTADTDRLTPNDRSADKASDKSVCWDV